MEQQPYSNPLEGQDPDIYIPRLERRAEIGDIECQRELGNIYRHFDAIISSDDENDPFGPTLQAARHWLEEASWGGSVEATLDLADMLSLEIPSPDNYKTAVPLYIEAAEKGMSAAWLRLGQMAEQAQGMPRDYAKAAEYYQKAIAAGHPLGYFNLALLYQNGKGVERDLKKAVQLFSTAEERGDHLAPYYRAQLLEGESPEAAEAAYRVAMERGVEEAKFALAQLLHRARKFCEARPLLEEVSHWGGGLSQQALKILRESPMHYPPQDEA